MRWQIGRRVFAPSWFSSLLTLVLLALFVRLGFWQLHRADEKQALMQQAAQGSMQTWRYDAQQAAHWPRYQRVQLAGRYDAAHQVLLDSMPSSKGQPGYRVLTPLYVNEHEVVLVDRGWVAAGTQREQRPNIAVSDAPREVIGMLDELPAPGHRMGEAGIRADVWPQLLNWPRHDELVTLYGQTLAARIVLLDAQQSDGYERHWQVLNQGLTPERHVGYAVQWFGFAVTLVILFVLLNWQRIDHD